MSRYNRHIILEDIGTEGQNKLNQAKVLVVGAGGLGCPILQYLAAAGVGTLGIMDYDVVELSNLQRQILFGTSVIGHNKALAAKKRLSDINEDININVYPEALTPSNAIQLFSDYDIIIDGTDNFETRYLINDAAVLAHKPLVYGAIYKYEGQVSVFNYKNGPSYRCVFPNPPSKNAVPNCSEVGVLGVLPGIIGSMQANEVLKIILGFDNVLSGKLFCYNSRTTQVSTLEVSKSISEFEKIKNRETDFINHYNIDSCKSKVQELSIEEAFAKENTLFIDVRELNELPKVEGLPYEEIPLSLLKEELYKIDKTKTLLLFCQSGIRSKQAVSILNEYGFKQCYSIQNGAKAIIDYLKIKV